MQLHQLENAAEWNERHVYNIECKMDAIARNHRIPPEKALSALKNLGKEAGRLYCQALRLWRQANELRIQG